MKLLPDRERVVYSTRRKHGDHPPGSLCLAWREDRRLMIEFTDGSVVESHGFLEGIETGPTPEETERFQRTVLRIFHDVHFVDDPY